MFKYDKSLNASIENINLSDGRPLDATENLIDSFGLGEGTLIIRFRNYPKQGYLPLVSFANGQNPSSYLTVCISHAQKIGIIKKYESSKSSKLKILDISGTVVVDPGLTHTLALSCSPNDGYSLYFNGNLICRINDKKASLFTDLSASAPISRAMIGGFFDSQQIREKYYNFTGDIEFLKIYSDTLKDDVLKSITSETRHNEHFLFNNRKHRIDAFYPGLDDSRHFRIPALIKTMGGTWLASIDKRENGPQDHSNMISTIVRRSTDDGNSFNPPITACRMYGRGQTIDSSLLQDVISGRIFLLNNSHPESTGSFDPVAETGFSYINGQSYLTLTGTDGMYLGTDDGRILDSCLNETFYSFDPDYNLYKNGICSGNFFNNDSPIQVPMTTYTLLTSSDDDGITWSKPRLLNEMVKKPFMRSLNVSPGNGIQLKNREYAGRICFPVYFSNHNNAYSSALVYSDDHGNTFIIGSSPNDNSPKSSKTISDDSEFLTECQAVEMPNGYIKLFMRNMSGCIAIATSRDGGKTFSEATYDERLPDPYCQCSVTSLPELIDGKPAVAFCNPASEARINGTIRIGLLDYNVKTDDYDIEWKYNKVVKRGSFAYSCLFPDKKNLGILYEGTPSTIITFENIPLSYIMKNQ